MNVENVPHVSHLAQTGAIIADGVVDVRKCISYLTIEYDGVIPEEYREAIGNRIYGCDDCQLVCPWNRHADITEQTDFHRREDFKEADLVRLSSWGRSHLPQRNVVHNKTYRPHPVVTQYLCCYG